MAGRRLADSGIVWARKRERWREDAPYKAPLPRLDPPLSREEWIERIERIRFEEADLLCPTCGSTTPKVVERKACVMCSRTLPLAAFDRHRTSADGRDSRCKECRSEANKRDAKRRRARLAVAS